MTRNRRSQCRHCPRSYDNRADLSLHMRGHHNPTRVEQAIAFGHSDEWMKDTLGATDDDIADAHARIYTANKETG